MRFVCLLSLLFVGACGGSVVGIDGSAPDATSDAPGKESGAGGDGGTVTCEQLASRLGPLREAAKVCSITAPQKQCGQFMKDLCCPLVVTDATSASAKAFAAAVDEYLKTCPLPSCPPVACPDTPSGVCGMQLTCFQL